MHEQEVPTLASPPAPIRANPLASLSLIAGLLGIAAVLLIWGTHLSKTGLAGDSIFTTFTSFEALWGSFWQLVAWWAVSLLSPLLAVVSGHAGIRRVQERQDGVTRGKASALVGVGLGYLIHVLSTGMILVTFAIYFFTSMTSS